MSDKVNVLIFPAGSENAIDIYDSLKYNLHFNIFGASGKLDHAVFKYPKENLFIDNLYITNENFMEQFNKILKKFQIDYIIPTHDAIASFLTKHQNKIHAEVVCSPYETARIAENKMLTYESLKGCTFCPKIYQSANEVIKYPVFLKPSVSAGGKGTHIVENKDELENILEKNPNLLICEYLPGKEYTIDCFTNKDGLLLFVGPRTRERVTMGITFHSERAKYNCEFEAIAKELNNRFQFRGAWFFQVKEDEFGYLKLMEFSVRQAGTMTFFRQLGVNFPLLSLFDFMGYNVEILFNDYDITLDRCLHNSYSLSCNYNKLYVDFDDTLIVNGKVNTTLMKLIYQCINSNKQIILLTKHPSDLDESLSKYRINPELFDEIIIVEPGKMKADYIDRSNAVFIDNYFTERLLVKEICNIPVFDVDAIPCLIDTSAI